MKRRTLRERAWKHSVDYAKDLSDPDASVVTMSNAACDSMRATGYYNGYLAGYRAARRRGK